MATHDASNLNSESVCCAVCDNEIRGGRWFARVCQDRWTVALCCPLCFDTFERQPASFLRRLETLERETLPPT